MPNLKRAALVLLFLPLSGCVSQRYMGVQITSTEPMRVTRVTMNGTTTLLYQVEKPPRTR